MYLFRFVLLVVARRHQTVSIDAFLAGIRAARTGVGLLHSQESADALDLTLETAVSEGLAFGGQPATRHPLSILLLLQG